MIKIDFKIAIAAFIVFIGLGFIGKGITGMYLLDFPEKTYCSEDSECPQDQVCCLFYQQNTGICEKAGTCQAIYEVTKQETNRGQTAVFLQTAAIQNPPVERPVLQRNYFSLILGVILIFVGIFSYIHTHKKREKKKK